ncbi:dienelactone hydrolase family protein [Xylogone sp. PMI_703]|nr:dienelactone hydrolase family protein [Xylogone sp. PMI_703]
MTSLPPGDCCTKGIVHEGTIAGRIEKIDNINTYFAYPPNSNHDNAIIILSDVFGIYKNAQLMADDYAARGYLTVIPDLFNGDAIDVDALSGQKVDLQEWLKKHQPPTVDPVIETVIRYLRTTTKVKNIGGVGFCYGGRYVVRYLKGGAFNAGYTAHPSFITCDELKAIKKPLSIAASEIDTIFTREHRFESEKILADLHIPYQINVYGGVEHGFALRGDLNVEEIRFATNQSFQQSINWFKTWLKN